MKIQRIIRVGIVMAITSLAAVSCVTTRKVAYLQDMKHETQIELENRFEAVIAPYDELEVIISCFDSELAKPFNLYSAAQGAIRSTQDIGYLVDQYGNIELPVLGTIHVAGLTRLQLQEKVQQLLKEGSYLQDPYVMVRFRDFKIFFLGANGGKAINITNERCTFLEALALSGDLSIYTNRKKIAVMREIDGQMVTRFLDPRSSKVFNDPFFMLQQNDFIITRNTNYRNFVDTYNQWSPFISIFSTITSVASLVMMFQYYTTMGK
ncbi:MAG: polysaccharide biosynthesis/export family protein [Bacteroidales bacterium]|nr:polysaccharide biosynthesis/export family protein [Bacteroidales bacterium]